MKRSDLINHEELLDLVQSLIRIPSVSGDEEELAAFLQKWLADRSVDCELQFAAPGRPNVIARLAGTGGGRSLILNAHTDMPEVLTNYRGNPWSPTVEDGVLYGAAITNTKGAVAAMCESMAALKRHRPLRGDVILTAVVGEIDLLGLGTKHALAAGIGANAAICGGPTELNVKLAHAGVYQFHLEVQGKPAHQKERELGDNAIYHAMRLLPFLDERKLTYQEHEVLGAPQMIIGQVQGGVLPSVTAPSCLLTGDVRVVPGMTKESITRDIQGMLAEAQTNHPDIQATLDCFVFSPPFAATSTDPFFEVLSRAHSEVRGAPLRFDRKRMLEVSDSGHLSAAGIQTALYGPGHFTFTEDRDHLAIKDLTDTALIYTMVASEYCA